MSLIGGTLYEDIVCLETYCPTPTLPVWDEQDGNIMEEKPQ